MWRSRFHSGQGAISARNTGAIETVAYTGYVVEYLSGVLAVKYTDTVVLHSQSRNIAKLPFTPKAIGISIEVENHCAGV